MKSSSRGNDVAKLLVRILACGIVIWTCAVSEAMAKDKGAKVFHPDHADVSAPLSSMRPIPPPKVIHVRTEHELPPGINQLPGATGLTAQAVASPESVLQDWLGPLAMPALANNFEGVGQGFVGPEGPFFVSSAPPDTDGYVGPNHYVQWVNTSFAVFDKSGNALYGPAAGNTLWQGFGGGCETNNDGDIIVRYDQLADRWIFTQFSVSTTPYLQCLAISTSPDPIGSYYRYSYSYSYFNDYPKLSLWPDGYYATFNMFNGNNFVGGEVCAFDRSKMLAGNAGATMQCFGPLAGYGGMLPSDLDGSTLPPSGAPNYDLAFGTNSLLLWRTHIDWTTPANSTLTGPTSVTGVVAFSAACSGGGTCIPQPGTTQLLDSLADRLMYRLAYRNFGDHEALVTNHSVTSNGVSGIRWYEIRSPGSAPAVYQQGTYQPDTNYRWMGSVAMDRGGNLAVGYSVSSSSVYPSIRYAGRLVTDSAGTLPQGESTMIAGTGSQTGGLNRWGDYSAMSVDPVDECTFWYTQEYIAANGSFNWQTRIGSFKYPGPPAPSPVSASANGNNVINVSWPSVTSVSTYHLYRATVSGGPYSEIASVSAPTIGYSDTTVSGGVTYYYVVASEAYAGGYCGKGVQSTAASATTTGVCAQAPIFAGLVSVSTPYTATCGLQLAWSAATAPCGGPVTYVVYRSTASSFSPSDANRIATGVTSTSYTDNDSLTSGTTYYYIVHAVDLSNGVEDANTVTVSGTPYGTLSANTFVDNVEGGKVAQVTQQDANWSIQTCAAHSPTHSWHMGDTNCTGIPIDGNAYSLVYSINVAANAVLSSASFWHTFQAYQNATYTDAVYFEIDARNTGMFQTVASWLAKNGSFATMQQAGPYDLSAYSAGHAATVRFRFRFQSAVPWSVHPNSAAGWNVDDFTFNYQTPQACSGPPDDVQHFTLTSTATANTLEWENPPNTPNPYGSTRLNWRTDATYPTGPSNGTTLVTKNGSANAHDSTSQGSLSSGNTYYFTAFANGASNGAGPWSGPGMNTRSAPAGSIATPIDWSFSSGASSLSSPKRGYNFSGVFEASNDRRLYSMLPGTTGGTWPAGWLPALMNGPAQLPPSLLQVGAGDIPSSPSTTKVAFAGSLDGNVYAFDADTGAELWRAALPGTKMITASPMLMHTSYGGIANLVLVGTRDATAGNEFCALHMGDGSQAWCFTNSGGQGGDGLGIGIISGPAYVDASWNSGSYPGWKRAFFAARSWGGGSSLTLWCVRFTASQVQRMWAINPKGTGETGDIDGSPTWDYSTGELLIGTNDGRVAAVNPDTGGVDWSRNLGDGAVKEFITFDSARNRLLLSTGTRSWSIPADGSTGADRSIVLNSPSRPLLIYNTSYVYVGARDPNNTANGLLVELDASQNWSQAGYTPKTVSIPSSSWLGGVTVDVYASPWVAHVGSASGRIYTIQVPLP